MVMFWQQYSKEFQNFSRISRMIGVAQDYEERWTGSVGPVACPSQSPDLS
jgi:hypothetical protein